MKSEHRPPLLQVDGVIYFLYLHHFHKGDRNADIGRNCTAIFATFYGGDVFVVVVFENNQLASIFI